MKGKHTMEEDEVISIPVSDGTERDFAIMDTFEFEGQGYLAVSLIEADEIQEGVYIYRYHNAEDGDVVVEQITLPAEYKKVTKFYEHKKENQILVNKNRRKKRWRNQPFILLISDVRLAPASLIN